MDSSEEVERPHATTAFGGNEQNETNEPRGFAPAPAQAAAGEESDAAEGDVRPPVIAGDIDATPVRARFADGGQ